MTEQPTFPGIDEYINPSGAPKLERVEIDQDTFERMIKLLGIDKLSGDDDTPGRYFFEYAYKVIEDELGNKKFIPVEVSIVKKEE